MPLPPVKETVNSKNDAQLKMRHWIADRRQGRQGDNIQETGDYSSRGWQWFDEKAMEDSKNDEEDNAGLWQAFNYPNGFMDGSFSLIYW